MARPSTPVVAAHPRSRGENFRRSSRVAPGGGSSPLTRGKHSGQSGVLYGLRLIPAHAGKTGDCRAYPACSTAHPRSRGENFWLSSHWRSEGGSSPLTRGKPARRGLEGMVRRLIPAHAGKTNPWSAEACQRAAHPRSRGENGLHGAFDVQRAGSSPLTRGKRRGGLP